MDGFRPLARLQQHGAPRNDIRGDERRANALYKLRCPIAAALRLEVFAGAISPRAGTEAPPLAAASKADGLNWLYARFARLCRFTYFDHRGNGLSDGDVENLSEDAVAAGMHRVATAAGLEMFAVFGLSHGTPGLILGR